MSISLQVHIQCRIISKKIRYCIKKNCLIGDNFYKGAFTHLNFSFKFASNSTAVLNTNLTV